MAKPTLREATRSLYESFRIDQYPGPHPYIQCIGEGADRIHVYLVRKPMGHEHAIPKRWQGYKVETRVVGRIVVGPPDD